MKPNELSEEAKLTQLIEECGELIQAAAKRLRILKGENWTPVTLEENNEALTEEAADVLNALDVLALDPQAIKAIKGAKMERWAARLKEAAGDN